MVAPKTDRSSVSGNARTSVSSGVASRFEVTKEDIRRLNDEAFREFVARLCMADLANSGIPTTRVTWGGDHREPDGGIDVRVELEDSEELSRWPRRRSVGFQVKATKMEPQDIQKEMRKNGELSQSIKALLEAGGAYIIATTDSVADKRFGKRKNAMQEAVKGEKGANTACLDYYGPQRLADWANELPAVVAWVHQTLSGCSLSGWKPYGQWSWQGRAGNAQRNTEDASEGGSREQRNGAPYLPDDKARFIANRGKGESLTLLEGLNRVRDALREPGTSVRLVGMSGVGKTRFVQALFEELQKAGDSSVASQGEGQANEGDAGKALPQEWALYTDTASEPNPTPQDLLKTLLLRPNLTVVLIVDNCPRSLHAELTSLLNEHHDAPARISLLTIEYDIREDQPIETEVFRLEGGSDALIEGIIKQQFPEIPDINVGVIARFSGGNARIAIALAGTVGKTDSLSGLSDAELFDRLFWQRNQFDQSLMNAAQACALVYSFNAEDEDDELTRLAALAEVSATSLYRHVAELQRRGLAQQRGDWRAVLPQAIADHLAARALESIPLKLIEKQMFLPGGERLLRSFSRRIGYLHESPIAQKLVRDWLSPDGWLGNLDDIFQQGQYERSDLHVEALANVAPVDPERALEVIERGVRESYGPNGEDTEVPEECLTRMIHLLRSIAYDAQLFDRCLNVLIRFARIASSDVPHGASQQSLGTDVLTSLFWMYLSGTHAKTQQRVDWLRRALQSTDDSVWRVAVCCLTAALKTGWFTSWYGFEFGARVRDFGWIPDRDEVQDWLKSFVQLAKEVGESDCPSATEARVQFASCFLSLWSNGSLEEELEYAAKAMFGKGWEEGWLAIRDFLDSDRDKVSEGSRTRLECLEIEGQPKDLVGRVRAFVLRHWQPRHNDGTDEIFDGKDQNEFARCLGFEVVKESGYLQTIAELVTSITDSGYQVPFGEGLAVGAEDLGAVWSLLVEALERHPESQRNINVLVGYLSKVFERDQSAFNDLLDAAMQSPSMRVYLPSLQCSAPLDDLGFARFLKLLDDESVPVDGYIRLYQAGASRGLSDEQLAKLIEKLCTRGTAGERIAIDVLAMHCGENESPPGEALREAATRLMEFVAIDKWIGPKICSNFEVVTRLFLEGEENEVTATAVRVIAAVRRKMDDKGRIRLGGEGAVRYLFELQAEIALDVLVGDETDDSAFERTRRLESDGGRSVLQNLSIDVLLSWCRAGPVSRWTRVAALVPAFLWVPGDAAVFRWTDHARRLLESAPEEVKSSIAKKLVNRIAQDSGIKFVCDDFLDISRSPLSLLDQLVSILGPTYAEDVSGWRRNVQDQIEREKQQQQKWRVKVQRAQNSRFE